LASYKPNIFVTSGKFFLSGNLNLFQKFTMLDLNRLVALGLLAFSSGYFYLSYSYNLLPFERFLAVKPNTMPIGLGIAGIICSLAILIQPKSQDNEIKGDGTVNQPDREYLKNLKKYNWNQGIGLLVLAIAYALSLRLLGFIIGTTSFLFLGGILLGDRRYILIIIVSITSSFIVWYLVDQVLTIFLRPWPGFIYQ